MTSSRGWTPVSRVEVDLDAIRSNCRQLAAAAGRPVLAVLKADAYGHGAVAVAETLENEPGCHRLVVARIEEACDLREHGIDMEITVLQCDLASVDHAERRALADAFFDLELTATVASLEDLRCWLELDERGSSPRAPVLELELDTGMARSGVPLDQLDDSLRLLDEMSQPRLRGLMTHLASSDVPASAMTTRQLERFASVADEVRGWAASRGVPAPELHVANSCGVLTGEATSERLRARVGGALFGLDLGATTRSEPTRPQLRPAMRVVSRLTSVRRLESGDPVGYNQVWRAPSSRFVGLVPVGYGDGYPRSAADATVLIGETAFPIVGRISMDSIVVDLGETETRAPTVGSSVCLLGEHGNSRIDAADLAARAGTISYELTCRFAARLPRAHFRGDRLSA